MGCIISSYDESHFSVLLLRQEQAHDRRQLEVQQDADGSHRVRQGHHQLPQVQRRQRGYPSSYADVIIAPIALHIPQILALNPGYKQPYRVAAQNASNYGHGAYTGEISPKHLKDIGLEWVILGHSERRTLFGEKDDLIVSKTKLALESGLKVIFCFGETLDGTPSSMQNARLTRPGKCLSHNWLPSCMPFPAALPSGSLASSSPMSLSGPSARASTRVLSRPRRCSTGCVQDWASRCRTPTR
jgi:hypothetical protein